MRIFNLIVLITLVSCNNEQSLIKDAIVEIKRHCTAKYGDRAKVEIMATKNSIVYSCHENESYGRIYTDTLPVYFNP